MVHSIKWDEKFFENSGLYIWIYNRGFIESTNEMFVRLKLSDIFPVKKQKGFRARASRRSLKNRIEVSYCLRQSNSARFKNGERNGN